MHMPTHKTQSCASVKCIIIYIQVSIHTHTRMHAYMHICTMQACTPAHTKTPHVITNVMHVSTHTCIYVFISYHACTTQ